MNNRIRELLEQAGVKYIVMPEDTIYENFAELLIQECLDCLSMELGNPYTPEEMLFQAKYRKIIREHFEHQ